jgi:hypothetical protein
MGNSYRYNVCLSFAGEQRSYVVQVARQLKQLGIAHFYDEDNSTELWGHDLAEKFERVFKDDSQYCVMFISQDYERKAWTRLERRSSLERQLNSDSPYILPVQFDDTKLPGLSGNIHYQDARHIKPDKLAELIACKVKGNDTSHAAEIVDSPAEPFRIPKRKASVVSTYAVMSSLIDDTVQGIKVRGAALQDQGIPFFYREAGARHQFRFGNQGNGSAGFALDLWMGGLFSDDGLSLYGGPGRQHHSGSNTCNGWGTIQQDNAGNPVLKYEGIGADFGNNCTYTTKQFIDLLWDYICDHLED